MQIRRGQILTHKDYPWYSVRVEDDRPNSKGEFRCTERHFPEAIHGVSARDKEKHFNTCFLDERELSNYQ